MEKGDLSARIDAKIREKTGLVSKKAIQAYHFFCCAADYDGAWEKFLAFGPWIKTKGWKSTDERGEMKIEEIDLMNQHEALSKDLERLALLTEKPEKTIYAIKTDKDIKDSIAVAQNNTTHLAEARGGSEVIYSVRSGDVLGKIATKYHCRVSQIKDWNNLHSDRLSVGQKLKIYPKASYLAQNKTIDQVKQEKLKTTNENGYVYYTIKKGDNLWNIANRYEGVSLEQLQELNKNINDKNLKTGTRIKIKPVG